MNQTNDGVSSSKIIINNNDLEPDSPSPAIHGKASDIVIKPSGAVLRVSGKNNILPSESPNHADNSKW